MKKHRSFVDHLKDWWWLYGVGVAFCSAITLWGNIPTRIARAEQGLEKTSEEVDDLKGWAREVQGYTRAMNQQQQQAPPQPWEFIREDGDWQVFRNPEDSLLYCCDGDECHPKSVKGRCR